MKAIEVFEKVVADRGALLVRPTKGKPGEYDFKPYFTGSKRGWALVDLFTASTVTQVYASLNETNRAKYAAMPLRKMADVAFKLVSK